MLQSSNSSPYLEGVWLPLMLVVSVSTSLDLSTLNSAYYFSQFLDWRGCYTTIVSLLSRYSSWIDCWFVGSLYRWHSRNTRGRGKLQPISSSHNRRSSIEDRSGISGSVFVISGALSFIRSDILTQWLIATKAELWEIYVLLGRNYPDVKWLLLTSLILFQIRYYTISLLIFDVTQIHLFARPGITNDTLYVACFLAIVFY